MSYETQNQHFKQAYNTGTDMWTTIYRNIPTIVKQFAETVKGGDIILDIGAGRGRLTRELVKYGFKVIGLELVKDIVEKGNDEARLEGLEKELRFIEGDVLDIPFTDEGFSGAIDIGLLHHLHKEDFAQYANEVSRVLVKGGHFLLVVLSKENDKFMSFNPKSSKESDFVYEGVNYHFFTQEEVESLFKEKFKIKILKTEYLEERGNEAHVVALMEKR